MQQGNQKQVAERLLRCVHDFGDQEYQWKCEVAVQNAVNEGRKEFWVRQYVFEILIDTKQNSTASVDERIF